MTLMCLLDWGTHSSKAIRLARPQSPPSSRARPFPVLGWGRGAGLGAGGSVAFARRGPSLPTV
jgi:hypothetical protein